MKVFNNAIKKLTDSQLYHTGSETKKIMIRK